jgi:hypothetical protein
MNKYNNEGEGAAWKREKNTQDERKAERNT